MTPEEQFQLLRKTSGEVVSAVGDAFKDLMARIRSGQSPRDAVQAVMEKFTGRYAEIMAAGLGVVMAESVGSASVMSAPVGRVPLSQRLYAQTQVTSAVVQSVVERHVRGFQDSRSLALQLYEGYEFREKEVLNMAKGNQELPKYMREALLDNPQIASGFQRSFAKIQADNLRTPELRAAYKQLLDQIDNIEAGPGDRHLANKLDVAFHERMRYFAKRIAETELHRNFAVQQAREIMDDDDIEYVQWRLSPMHPVEDICDYFAGLDRYGLGPGVYPKALAPVAPAHPFCKCVLSPRLDLTGQESSEVEGAEQQFFSKYTDDEQRRISGSQAKLDRVRGGSSAWEVHNASIVPEYRVKPASQV